MVLGVPRKVVFRHFVDRPQAAQNKANITHRCTTTSAPERRNAAFVTHVIIGE